MSAIRIPIHRPCVGEGELRAIERVFESRWLGPGAVTRQFQEAIRRLIGVRHVLAVNTGTAALHMALHTLDIGPGDEVILPSLTFVSSAQAVLAVGARPVFCEVQSDSLTMDAGDAARKLSARTRAIMPVHYGGRICDMASLRALAAGRDIRLVEDAAHAFGSRSRDGWAGALGDAGCFSFDPIKNITCGGGGALVTNDDGVAARAGAACNVGVAQDSWSRLDAERPWFYEVVAPGFRYQLGNTNAAIGLAQFERLEEFRARKQSIVRAYDRAFRDMDGVTAIPSGGESVFPFNYVVRVPAAWRNRLMAFLGERGIGSAVQFIPCHLQPLFAGLCGPLPVTERLYTEIVTLPLYFEMSDADVEEVVSAVRQFWGGAK